ncbi:hypothetical protein PDM80_22775 [Bacillus cereus group sp. Bcc02]|uniref:hypothetical protein n=1 Tax=Bacillus cereus group sp. Bcc02 TaxID=3018101 RepID=UPI000936C76B|nr:hypothetical protein [Bacillus cereus group sp. Bcc02]MDA2034585.1 hypothetical protein [Bacillus cereus group sp. Bcc02]HDR7932594.1 hypothetical protein [Bacillus pacificus]
MQERIDELKAEMKQAIEEKRIIEKFISEKQREIPDVVLVTLKQRIRKLNSTITCSEIRLETYN